MTSETPSSQNAPDAADPGPSSTSPSGARAADRSDYLAWQARMIMGAERLARNEDERRASGLRLF